MRIRAYEEIVSVHFFNARRQSFTASKDSTHIENGRMYYSGMSGALISVSTACITAVYVDGSRIF